MKYKFKTPPYGHQLKALEMSWNRGNVCLFHGNGNRQN